MSDLYQRVRYLPDAIARTHRKLNKLLCEAERLGLQDMANEAWDDIIHEAQSRVMASCGSIGFGDGAE
jgi:hypothetical protein